MIVETVRLSKRARDQLIWLKRHTGIEHWNVLSRWALCLSLTDPLPPSAVAVGSDAAVEMTWKVFGGDAAEIYGAMVRQRCIDDDLGTDQAVVSEQLRLHLHRGIGMLAGNQSIRSIEDLVSLVTTQSDSPPSSQEGP